MGNGSKWLTMVKRCKRENVNRHEWEREKEGNRYKKKSFKRLSKSSFNVCSTVKWRSLKSYIKDS